MVLVVSLFALWACEKEENKVYYEGGTAPVLSASRTGTIPMSFANSNQEALKLTWTNPDYKFTTGVSSQDVSYILEIDTVGANFSSPIKQTISIKNDLSYTFTQGKLNEFLLNALLVPEMPHQVEMRIRSSMGSNSAVLTSNTLRYTITPFKIPPKVQPPTAGTLWVTGSAMPSGWSNPLSAAHQVSQKFTRVSETLYEATMDFVGGGGYKLIQEQGNWDTQYRFVDGGSWEGGDFLKQNSDPQFPGPPTAGRYKITVNFQTGKFSVTKI